MDAAACAEPLWRLSGVQARHGQRLWPSAPLALDIPTGRTAVLGLSGAGKTSLLNLLSGFVSPAKGTIQGPARIAWVPQNHGLWMAHTVTEHLTLAGAISRSAADLLEQFDLTHRAASRADTLSIGESARLAVARALAQDAPVLIMDEPLAHVDIARARKYWGIIRDRVAAARGSLIFATHQPEIALAEAERAICLHEGAVIYAGAMSALYEAPSTPALAHFLGPSNWITPGEAKLWLGAEWKAERCIRPERLTLKVSDRGFSVVQSRFLGSHAETEVRGPEGVVRLFVHRPASALPIGAQVSIQEALLA